jgi:hypothetical protein
MSSSVKLFAYQNINTWAVDHVIALGDSWFHISDIYLSVIKMASFAPASGYEMPQVGFGLWKVSTQLLA